MYAYKCISDSQLFQLFLPDEYSSPMNYKFMEDSEHFTLGVQSGWLQTQTYLEPDVKHVLYAVAQDNDLPQDTST